MLKRFSCDLCGKKMKQKEVKKCLLDAETRDFLCTTCYDKLIEGGAKDA